MFYRLENIQSANRWQHHILFDRLVLPPAGVAPSSGCFQYSAAFNDDSKEIYM